ncbi:MAG TPA: ATP-binding cassette domain-containing protein, partial [Thermoanaerobaculia bacterium]|nr:ATP-binding cassette domain-containing protein [Thermoanaerobaculia bacterium]
LHPTAGEVSVAGFRPAERHADFLRSIMFVAGQKQQLLWDLPPAETFELNRAIYGISRASYRETLDELVAVLDLEPLLQKPTRQLSLGERMKCELAAALIHRPSVLFLDEPTIGLDVTMQAALRSFIRRYNEEHGATVLLTSHYMVDVAALAPRVLVIDHGRLTFDGLLADLVRRVRPYRRVTLRFGAPAPAEVLAELGARVESVSDGIAVLQVGEASLKPLIAQALERLPVVDLTVEEAPLEDVIAELFTAGGPGAPRPADAAAEERAREGPTAGGTDDARAAARREEPS